MHSGSTTDKRFDPARAERLLSLERYARLQPDAFLRNLGIREGHRVADLGCGPGFWALPLAEIVGPNGRVVALDASPRMFELMLRQNPPAWLDMLEEELPATGLDADWADWVWMAFVWHEVEPASEMAREASRILRSGGQAAILEWRPDASGESGPPLQHRVAAEAVIRELARAGFRDAELRWQDPDQYLVVARKP
ncbi:MAG: methyltransferase domain-containing protein [Fimbriimonadales bacterium]|nr:methyltransferase domain-containing protein [Fimbriimonadales bacterium]